MIANDAAISQCAARSVLENADQCHRRGSSRRDSERIVNRLPAAAGRTAVAEIPPGAARRRGYAAPTSAIRIHPFSRELPCWREGEANGTCSPPTDACGSHRGGAGRWGGCLRRLELIF